MNKKEWIDQFVKSLTPKQFNIFLEIISYKFTIKEIEELQKAYILKNLDVKTSKNNIAITKIPFIIANNNKNINRLLNIISNEELINKIGGLRMLFTGPTGTGKTTIINYLINNSKNIKYKYINYEELISPKMGQTQINIINLGFELSESKNRMVIFIDEMDSLINNRETSDLGEHSRIVATFLKFLDMVGSLVIVIGATNYVNKIDNAVVRRFNIKIPATPLSYEEFIKSLKYEGLEISTQRIKFLKDHLKNDKGFTIGQSKNVIDEWIIKKEIGEKAIVWEIIVEKNMEYFEFNKNLSIRDERTLKYIYGKI